MQFLFNHVILELGDPAATLDASPAPLTAEEAQDLGVDGLRSLFQHAVFAFPRLPSTHPERAVALAALAALTVGANAAAALLRKDAQDASHVYLRFTTVPDTVMAHLARLQEERCLSFAAAELAVWSKPA